MERANGSSLGLVESNLIALLYIQASQQSRPALKHAAQRVRRNVRKNDHVLLHETLCVIILPATLPEGAQVVARRIYALLADVEFELQIMYDGAASALIQRLQNEYALVVVEEGEIMQKPGSMMLYSPGQSRLPFLAFLANYPSLRLLHLFPYELACQYRCVPVGTERGVLTLATCQQLDQSLISHFHEVTQHNIFQVRCEGEMIEDILKYWRNTLSVREEKTHGYCI